MDTRRLYRRALAHRGNARIHDAEPEGRQQCQQDHRAVATGQMRRVRQQFERLIALGRRQVVVGVPRQVDQQPVAYAACRVPRVLRSDRLVGSRRHLKPFEVLNLATAAPDIGEPFESIFADLLRQQFTNGSRIAIWSDATYRQDERYFLITGAGKELIGNEWAAEVDFISEMTGSRKPDWYPGQSTDADLENALADLAERLRNMR